MTITVCRVPNNFAIVHSPIVHFCVAVSPVNSQHGILRAANWKLTRCVPLNSGVERNKPIVTHLCIKRLLIKVMSRLTHTNNVLYGLSVSNIVSRTLDYTLKVPNTKPSSGLRVNLIIAVVRPK